MDGQGRAFHQAAPMYRIRDWDKYFERDRTRKWKRLQWVPIPNKQGSGYRRIMAQPKGLEIFACWIAIVEIASTTTPRGDLTKYSVEELSLLSLIPEPKLTVSIKYLSEVLDWIEIVTNLDTNVNNLDTTVKIIDSIARDTSRDSSVLFSSVQSSSSEGEGGGRELPVPVVAGWRDSFEVYQSEAEAEFDRLYEDLEWIAIQKRDYPGIAVRRTLEKLWRDFWGTSDAWEYRRKKSKSQKLNWQRTIQTALSDRRHRLYYGRGEMDEEQRQIDAARMAKAVGEKP